MATIEEKYFITSFVRSKECFEKCGHDGKDEIIPSTDCDVDHILDIDIVHRSCGCRLVPANREAKFDNYFRKFCFKIEYYFVGYFGETHGVLSYKVV